MSAAVASSPATDGHRTIIVATLMASFMQSVALSLPNAALLYLKGTLSMSDDEVGWVFTSYIAASVITMPMTRWLAGRYGRKTIYLLSIAIFALGLVLAARATTPLQFVAARIVQGGASGPLAPLSMAILLDILPLPQHARVNLASISASCPTLASSIVVPEVIEVAAGAKWGCMAAVMSLVPHNIAQ